MDAVTYPQPNVIEFIEANVIPLKIPADDKALGSKYNVKWTPLLLLLDAEGNETFRSLGFFEPDAFIARQLLGIGKTYFDRAERKTAVEFFNRVINAFPDSPSAPEAIYLRGVADFIETKDAAYLKSLYKDLADNYAESQWVMRAKPYSLL